MILADLGGTAPTPGAYDISQLSTSGTTGDPDAPINNYYDNNGTPDGQTFTTGKYRYRYCRTPHLPHGWDAGVLFEETQKTLLCSDLFHQSGNMEPLTSNDIVGRTSQAMKEYQAGILAEYVPYNPLTAQNLSKLANLKPKTLAIMHGSSFTGDCARALDDLNGVYREVFGREK